MSFDGLDDGVMVPHDNGLNAFPLTVSAWINTTNRETNRIAGVVNKYYASSYNGYSLHVAEGHIRAWYWADASRYVWGGGTGLDGGDVADGNWHHVAFTVDTSGGKLYVDGALEASRVWQGTPGPPTTNTTPLYIGLYPGVIGNYLSHFRGQVDDVRIWNVARSQQQIQAHMNHPLTGAESNLVAYWSFDEQTPGPTTGDRTRLANTGILTNSPLWQPRPDQPQRPYPQMLAARGASGEVVLSCDAVPGAGFQVLNASTLEGSWQPLVEAPPQQATNEVMACRVFPEAAEHYFCARLEPIIYAITDVAVADGNTTMPQEYTGLGHNVATRPYLPNVLGARVAGQNVNIGIGGTLTTIWARYSRLGSWFDVSTPILTDIAVTHWVNWVAFCPDGHALNNANPICPDGWMRASGTSNGEQGALTTQTDSACWHTGLCVRYQPLGEVLAQNSPYIVKLSISLGNSAVLVPPPGEVGWAIGGIDIHSACGDGRYVYVAFKKEVPAPVAYLPSVRCGISDVMVSDYEPRVPSDYTGLVYGRATDAYLEGSLGVRLVGDDVNVGIGGNTTTISAKFVNLETASDPNLKVLSDIAVVHWVNWSAVCPDGHPLPDANPCVDGWQRANGTSNGEQGALTTRTDDACWHNGLCVRYKPLSAIWTNELYIEKLALSNTSSTTAVYPPEIAAWAHATLDVHSACGDGQFVYVCYAKRSLTMPPLPSNQQKLDILTRYAPRVWLEHHEQYWPSSVEFAFAYLARFTNSSDGGNYWLRTTQTLTNATDVLPYFHGTQNVLQDPVYAFWVEKQPAGLVVDLVYFFYYPYNQGKFVVYSTWENHVSDWEHITVRLAWGQPMAVYLSAHNFGAVYPWNSFSKTNATHPVVYAARGSHGCWAEPGDHIYDRIRIVLDLYDLVDSCSEGRPWDTWQYVQAFDYNSQTGLGTNLWPAWMSVDYTNPGTGDPSVPGHGPIYRWGNPQQGDEWFGYWQLVNGPTGPASKTVWDPALLQ